MLNRSFKSSQTIFKVSSPLTSRLFATYSHSDEEMKIFARHSGDWWNKEQGAFSALHDYNHMRVPFICESSGRASHRSNAFRSLDGLKIMDVGCGGGILANALADQGAHVTAIDIGEPAIDAARSYFENRKQSENIPGDIEFRVSPVEDIQAEGLKFDVVVSSEVIEHVDSVENFFNSLVNCVKPGGTIVLTTLNKTCESYALGIVVAERILGFVPPGTHDWEHFVAPETLIELGKNHNLRHIKTQGVAWIPFLRTFIPEPTRKVNYMIAFQKPSE